MSLFGKSDDVPTVPREMYVRERDRADRIQAQYDALVAEVVKMKKKGFEPAVVRKPGVPEKSDEQLVREAESAAIGALARESDKEFVARMAKDLEKQGLAPKEAVEEAMRLRAEVSSTTLHPSDR